MFPNGIDWNALLGGAGIGGAGLAVVIGALSLWTIFWKGLALWHAARRGQPWWFVILLLVNTVGILEIIYLFGVAKVKGGDLFRLKK